MVTVRTDGSRSIAQHQTRWTAAEVVWYQVRLLRGDDDAQLRLANWWARHESFLKKKIFAAPL
jgi:hypothetical protein